MTLEQAFVFEFLEPRGEEPVGDARDGAPILGESTGSAHPGQQDGGVPLAACELDGALEAPARGLVDVPEFVQACAALVETGDGGICRGAVGFRFATYHK